MNSMDQTYQPMIDRAAELACRYEVEYFGCSQSTLAALIEAFGIGGRDILRAATAFSGGVVRRGNVCGALSGGLMMIGFLAGRDDLQMKEQTQRGMGYADRLCQRFEDAYGSVVCREIQKKKYGRSFDLRRDEDREALHAIMAKDPEACQGLTRDAARWAGEIVAEILQEGPPMARMLT